MNKSNTMSGRENSSEGRISAEVKKYRHTKMVVEHANPLFDSWLLEWQKEAEKRNSKMKYNFQRVSGYYSKIRHMILIRRWIDRRNRKLFTYSQVLVDILLIVYLRYL